MEKVEIVLFLALIVKNIQALMVKNKRLKYKSFHRLKIKDQNIQALMVKLNFH